MSRRQRCQELVARTPVAVLERADTPQDWTHLQRCGAPAIRDDRCARHLTQPNTTLNAAWKRFLRLAKL